MDRDIRIQCANGEIVDVPQAFAMMSTKKPHQGLIQVPQIEAKYAAIVNQYCQHVEYQKTQSTLNFPMASRFIEDSISQAESQFLQQYKNDFNELLEIFKAAKALQVESLYQLMAATIASFFRQRTSQDVKEEFNLGLYDKNKMISDKDIEEKFKWCIQDKEREKVDL